MNHGDDGELYSQGRLLFEDWIILGLDKLDIRAELKLRTLSAKQFNHGHQSKGCSWKWKVRWREPDDWAHNHYTSIHYLSQKPGHWSSDWSLTTLSFSFSISSILSQISLKVAWSLIIRLCLHLSFDTGYHTAKLRLHYFQWPWDGSNFQKEKTGPQGCHFTGESSHPSVCLSVLCCPCLLNIAVWSKQKVGRRRTTEPAIALCRLLLWCHNAW